MATASNTVKRTIELQVKDQKVVLRTEADPSLVAEVTALVNERLAQADARVRTTQAHLSAILALFDLAEEYVQAKRRAGEHQREFRGEVDRLVSFIESDSV